MITHHADVQSKLVQARSKHLNSGAAQMTNHVSEMSEANVASNCVGSRGPPKGAKAP